MIEGASVARVARAHGINANQVFGWLKLYSGGATGRREPCDQVVAGPRKREFAIASDNNQSSVLSIGGFREVHAEHHSHRTAPRAGAHRKQCRSRIAVALLGLGLWSAVLRFHFLFQPMRDDEAYTFLQYSSHPFYAALSFYNAPNNHLFHTLLVRLTYLVFGNHIWSLRLPVFLGGIALVPAAYTAARSLCRTEAALLAAGLVASSSILIEFSTNARGYILVCLVFQLLISLAAYGLRHANRAAWIALAIVAAIGFYTIPVMLYPFGGLVVWLLVSATLGDAGLNVRTVVAGVFVAAALTVFLTLELYSPVFAVSGPAAVLANKWVVARPFHIFVRELPRSLVSTWRDWNRDLPTWLTSTLAAGCALSLFRQWVFRQLWVGRNSFRWSRLTLTFALVAWVGLLLLVQRVIPFERVWLFALPLYFIEAASGVTAVLVLLPQLRLRHAMVFVAIALSVLAGVRVIRSGSVLWSNEGRGLDELAVFLKGELRRGDSVVVALPSDVPLLYYFQKEGVPASFLNAQQPKRMLVVVNGVSGDTVQKVLEMAKMTEERNQPALLRVRYDSASLYEVVPQPSKNSPDR